jgi:L-alanine-DL-glutamate epimerase-like enolase superfamily enzyme
MQIREVSGHALSSSIDPPQERLFHGGTRRILKRDVVVIVVETADGARGFAPAGASSSAMREYFEGDSQATFADLIEGPVANALEGQTIEDIKTVHDIIDQTDLPHRLRNQAIAAVDIALYDLRGKEVGAPISELLAEHFTTTSATSLPLYASGGMYMEADGYAKQAAVLDDLGFVGYKYRPGIGPAADRQILETLRETVEMEIMIDAHTWWKMDERSYGADQVRSLVRHAGKHGAYWVEEPVAPENHEGYADLASLGTPLAGGESEESPEGLILLADTGAVDFLQGDVRHHRGFTGCKQVIKHCQGQDITYVPHNFGTWLGFVANAHLVAAAPDGNLLEYPIFKNDPALTAELAGSNNRLRNVAYDPGMYPFKLAFEIINENLDLEDGELTVPDGPGLGVSINTDVFEAYPFVKGPWTEFNYNKG